MRQTQAVFYVKGPGRIENEGVLLPVYREGLLAMKSAGQLLAYHAFDHDPAIWAVDFDGSNMRTRAGKDLDSLQDFIDQVFDGTGTDQAGVFLPLFRQPYGGLGVNQSAVEEIVRQRGWVYHGYRIDSLDWLGNADVDPALMNAVRIYSPEDHAEAVPRQLAAATRRHKQAGVVDVLFHVNAITAQHLDTWISLLEEEFASMGRTVQFDVPECYLNNDDRQVDTSIYAELLN